MATLLGRSYSEVLRSAWGARPPRRGNTLQIELSAPEMAQVLRREYGLAVRVARPTRLPARPSILLFDWRPETDLCSGYHAVVYLPGRRPRVLDPGITHDSLPLEFYLPRWLESGRETLLIESNARSH
jgi:hypothetical protein